MKNSYAPRPLQKYELRVPFNVGTDEQRQIYELVVFVSTYLKTEAIKKL